ncbi:UDP-glucose 6-dehydrogenase [Mycobacteroides abscessus subsp. abscessus]|nr:UDP-glucose 6-dehydrogenase [Mycobacteroides abscessus subsp. abscessus]
MRTKVIVDGRNCLDAAKWVNAGWRVFCLGNFLASYRQ